MAQAPLSVAFLTAASVDLEVTAQTEKRGRSDTDGGNERWPIANPSKVYYFLHHMLVLFLHLALRGRLNLQLFEYWCELSG